MDFKTAIKTFGMILAFLIILGSFIVAGSTCMNVAKVSGPWILNIPGFLSIILGCGATFYVGYKLVKKGQL